MEERERYPSNEIRSHNHPHFDQVIAPKGENHDESTPETLSQKTFRSGTYIIQVPKDQIYRVPPAENAVLAERLRASQRKRTRGCRPVCLCILGVVIVVVAILGALGGIASSVLKHDNPIFSIEGVLVKNQSRDSKKRPEYYITLKARNGNRHVNIEYRHEGSDASLLFKKKKIAAGKIPGFNQDSKSSTDFKILLHGANIALPEDISRSINVLVLILWQRIHISSLRSVGLLDDSLRSISSRFRCGLLSSSQM